MVSTDIAFLKEAGPDDPAYREALAVLAGGAIPKGVDLDEGGAPAAGHGPFPDEVGKGWIPGQPRDHLGRFTRMAETGGGSGGSPSPGQRFAPTGAAIRSAAPAIDVINEALGLSLPTGGSFFRRGTHDKLLVKRPAEFAYTMTYLNKTLRKPDYVGRHPDHPGRIQLVRLTPGKDFDALLVSIEDRRATGGDYRIATAHSIKIGQVEARVEKGWLQITKKARR